MSGLGTAMLIGITSMTGLLKGSNWAELLSLSHTHIHTHTHTHTYTHTHTFVERELAENKLKLGRAALTAHIQGVS